MIISVPAIWALSGLGLSVLFACAMIGLIFIVLFIGFWVIIFFLKHAVIPFITGWEYD